MTFPSQGQIASIAASQSSDASARRENSTRDADARFTFTTTGTGEFVVLAPLVFDCVFAYEPVFTSGAALVKPPDTTLYHYPVATALVARWITDPAPTRQDAELLRQYAQDGESGTTAQPFYKGAFMVFVVRCDTLITQPQDDVTAAVIASLQSEYAQAVSDSDKTALAGQIARAEAALRIKNEPAQPVLHHHMRFVGAAIKKLDSSIVEGLTS